VLGSTPSFSLFDGIGHAPSCGTRFEPSAVLSMKATSGGEEEPRLVAAGRFTGRCGSRVLAFESVPVAKVGVVTSMSHDGLAPFEIDHAHPEWQVSLRAIPQDERGAPLNPGTGPGFATWVAGEGCATTVQLVLPVEGRLSDTVSLEPRAAGKCSLGVSYLGAHTSVTVTVR